MCPFRHLRDGMGTRAAATTGIALGLTSALGWRCSPPTSTEEGAMAVAAGRPPGAGEKPRKGTPRPAAGAPGSPEERLQWSLQDPETADVESLPTALDTAARRGHDAVELSEAQRLVQLRRQGLMKVDDSVRVVEERVTMRHLADAAAGLLGSLERLSQDEGTWERLTAAERNVGALQRTE